MAVLLKQAVDRADQPDRQPPVHARLAADQPDPRRTLLRRAARRRAGLGHPLRPDVPVPQNVTGRRPPHEPRGTRPATARTLRGAASQIATADTRLAPIESQNAST